jgi:hypothetical protein
MKKIIKYFILISLLGWMSGCADFLDISDKESLSPEIFPSTIQMVDGMLTSSYAGSHQIGLYGCYWFPMGIYLYDKTSNTYDVYPDGLRVTQLANQTDINCRYITQTYVDIFRWIALSNAALEGIEYYRNQYATESEKAPAGLLDYMRGQALFNRALAYWHGQIFFEISPDGLGLPLFGKTPVTVEEMTTPRATTKQSWDFIIRDLIEAKDLLKGHNNDPVRATEWAAKGVLAKSYMQAGYTAEAREVLEDIIFNSGKKLVSFEEYENMFYADTESEFNAESLHELNMIHDPTSIQDETPWARYNSGSAMPMVFGPWPMDLDKTIRAKDDPMVTGEELLTQTTGAWGNNYVHDANIRRFGFALIPPKTRMKNPDYKDNLPRSINNYPLIYDPSYTEASKDLRINKKVDPRLYVCSGQPWVSTLYDPKGRETFYDKSPELLINQELMHWSHRKFTNRRGYENTLKYSSGANYPIVRLADIYLLYAEVLKDTDPEKALEYINKVHRRAYDQPVDQPSPYDYHSLTARTKTADPNDHLANDVLKYERWAELFAEGQWWYDIRRWKIGQQEVNYFKQAKCGNLTFPGDDYYVQPIPRLELERCNGKVKQSGNYPGIASNE